MLNLQLTLITLLVCNATYARLPLKNIIRTNNNNAGKDSENAKRQAALVGIVGAEVGALDGLAVGAATGEVFGPVGAVVGGLFGLLGGLFGSSSSHSFTHSHGDPSPSQEKPTHVAVNPAFRPVVKTSSVSEALYRNVSLTLRLPTFSILAAYGNPRDNIPDQFCLGIKMEKFGPGLYGGECMTSCPTDSPPDVEQADVQVGCAGLQVCCIVKKVFISSGCIGDDSSGILKLGLCSFPGSCNDTTHADGCDGLNNVCCIAQ